jgi:drug/metabolite transporter (DMT)-like permease
VGLGGAESRRQVGYLVSKIVDPYLTAYFLRLLLNKLLLLVLVFEASRARLRHADHHLLLVAGVFGGGCQFVGRAGGADRDAQHAVRVVNLFIAEH